MGKHARRRRTITKTRLALVGTACIGALALVASPAGAGSGSSVGGSAHPGYNAIPGSVSGNVPSQGFECCQTNEFGDEVGLGGTPRTLQSMSVVLSSWGCQSGHWGSSSCSTTPGATFDVPLTFTIYADNAGSPGAILAQQMRTVAVPYRPSASPKCTDGKWYNTSDKACYNGFPQVVTMTFPTGTTLPDRVFWSVAFNTSTSGYHPVGTGTACYTSSGGCGYDSLNVGAFSYPKAPYSGTDIHEDEAFRNGTVEAGWSGNRPLGEIVTGT